MAVRHDDFLAELHVLVMAEFLTRPLTAEPHVEIFAE